MITIIEGEIFRPISITDHSQISAHRRPTSVAPDPETVAHELQDRGPGRQYVKFRDISGNRTGMERAFLVTLSEEHIEQNAAGEDTLLASTAAQFASFRAEGATDVSVFVSIPVMKQHATKTATWV